MKTISAIQYHSEKIWLASISFFSTKHNPNAAKTWMDVSASTLLKQRGIILIDWHKDQLWMSINKPGKLFLKSALRNYEKAFLRVWWSIRTTLRNKNVLFILRIRLKHYNMKIKVRLLFQVKQLMLNYHLSFSLASLNMKIIHSEDIRQQYSGSVFFQVNEPFIYSVSVSLHQIPFSHQQYFLFIKKTV